MAGALITKSPAGVGHLFVKEFQKKRKKLRRLVISLRYLINPCLVDHLWCIVSILKMLTFNFPLTVTHYQKH